ncbi:UPF0146 family protein [Thermococcus sp.]|uniref:UPF0146 family protein n=1 Tax=Thermococcus sp. TaxID=35749 RepID=UPI0025DD3A1A|nr:UPF0146 family protein [Thermococcus sp.]
MPIEDFADFLLENTRGQLTEVGIGFQFKVALRLIERGRDVTAVDRNPRAVEKARALGINAYVDDIFRPNLGLYERSQALYSIRPTPEIIKPILKLGRSLGVPVFIVPLAGDTVPRPMRLINFRGLAIYTTKPI